MPHAGDWTEAGVVAEAFAFNSPLVVVPVAGTGGMPATGGLVEVEGLRLGLGALKRAEVGEGLILRVYEPHGARGTATLRFSREVAWAERVDLLEEPVEGEARIAVEGGRSVRLEVRPFEVVSLRLGM